MTAINVTLPHNAIAVLDGHHEAEKIAQATYAAYWLHGRDDDTCLFLLNQAHEEFARLAAALGDSIAPMDADAEVAA